MEKLFEIIGVVRPSIRGQYGLDMRGFMNGE